MRRKKYVKDILLCVLAVALFYCLLVFINSQAGKAPKNTNPIDLSVLLDNPIGSQPIQDSYQYQNDAQPRSIYITVYPGTNQYGTRTYTLADLQATSKFNLGPDEPEAYANVKIGSPSGMQGEIGYETEEVNATIRLRGHSTRAFQWKSYKLKLYDSAGLYLGQDIINLNKHPDQGVQLLNKLCFDLFVGIPDFTSINTNFMHVYIKDLSKEQPDADFVDYGLYVTAEEPGDTFLEQHGLDPNGMLYKAENFEFFRYPDVIKSQFDPEYDEASFETRLEVINGSDHRKLIQVLDAVNDMNQDINDVFDLYFDRDNYFTWLAVNILVGNLDTTNQNFLLYSPVNSPKWYFLPWDYDGSLRETDLFPTTYTYMSRSLQGIHRYMSVQLHKRMMSNPENRQELSNKIDQLYQTYLSPDRVDTYVQEYLKNVQDILFSPPDRDTVIRSTPALFLQYNNGLKDTVTSNRENYHRTLDYPTPFFMEPVTVQDDEIIFTWSESMDFAETPLHYTLDIATDAEMTQIVYRKEKIKTLRLTVPAANLIPGSYYVRVRAYNGLGREQSAYNEIKSKRYYGVMRFTV